MREENWFLALKALIALVVSWFLQFPPLLYTWFLFVLLDVVTGFSVAWRARKVKSAKMFTGGLKKVGILIIILVIYLLEHGLDSFPLLGWLPIAEITLSYYLLAEALSVCENLSLLGAPVPPWLVKRLRVYHEEIEDRLDVSD